MEQIKEVNLKGTEDTEVKNKFKVTVIMPQSGLKTEYLDMLSSFGEVNSLNVIVNRLVPADPIFGPLKSEQDKDNHLKELAAKTDLFLFPGGRDVSSSITGAVQSYQGGDDPHYSWMFSEIVEGKTPIEYFKDVPKFGICLGFQILTHYYVGLPLKKVHVHALEGLHSIQTKFYGLDGITEFKMTSQKESKFNSRHNQGFVNNKVNIKHLNYLNTKVIITDTDDKRSTNCIEGVYIPELQYVGLQGHPESFQGRLELGDKVYNLFQGHPLQLELMGKLIYGYGYTLPEYTHNVYTLAGGAVDELA